MKIFKISFLLIFSLSIYAFNIVEQDTNSEKVFCDSTLEPNVMGTCFLKKERVSDMNRICTYSCISGDKSITIDSAKLCPLSIKD